MLLLNRIVISCTLAECMNKLKMLSMKTIHLSYNKVSGACVVMCMRFFFLPFVAAFLIEIENEAVVMFIFHVCCFTNTHTHIHHANHINLSFVVQCFAHIQFHFNWLSRKKFTFFCSLLDTFWKVHSIVGWIRLISNSMHWWILLSKNFFNISAWNQISTQQMS